MKNKSLVIIILVLLDMTPGLLMNTMLITTTRGQLMLENMATTVVLSVKTRRSGSATSIPMRTLARSPRQLARRLLTPFTLRSEEIIHTVCEEAHQQYHHSQHVAGHESNVVAGSAGFHEEHQGESYGHG